MGAQLQQRLISVDEYHRMIEIGIFSKGEKLELLNGKLVFMSPIGSKHAGCLDKIAELFIQCFIGKARVRVQNPLLLPNYSEPEPDIAVVKRKPNYYTDRHPQADEVYLIVEVADTSLEIDREEKYKLYASANIPVYWIVNLRDNCLEVYTEPLGELYKNRRLFLPGDMVELPHLDQQIAVNDLLI
ncbi:MAG TPA: Uma2 family endonuclease [Saprospiraceae bacterium]|nr:Uma2 family endonuclease [Saprospiraceae bacterium]HMQ82192.1 Uma2 family endonuclease [Saprospiraceae bacterium]